jgi:hypothetical protein
VVNDSSQLVAASSGASFAAPESWGVAPFYGELGTLVGDVDGDGKQDLIAPNSAYQVFVLLSTGSAFGTSTSWSANNLSGATKALVGDLNGDGKVDLFVFYPTKVSVQLSDGTTFGTPQEISATAIAGTKATLVADVDGDKKADVIAVNDAGHIVYLSNGTTLLAAATWSTTPMFGDKLTAAADMNGDGRADLIGVASGYSPFVSLSQVAGSFGAPIEASSLGAFFGANATLVGDVNGDGFADLVAVEPTKVRVKLGTGSMVKDGIFQAESDWLTAAAAGTKATLLGTVK